MKIIPAPEVQFVTKEGECKIYVTLEINVNLNGMTPEVKASVKEKEKAEEDTGWVIPDFKSKEKVQFGKQGG